MRPTAIQYAKTLKTLSEEGGVDVTTLVGDFLSMLRRRGETKKLDGVLKCLENLEREEKNEVVVTAALAREVDEDVKRSIASQAETLFPGKRVALEYAVDPSLIGGVRLRTDEMLYDASVRHQLGELKKTIVK